MNQLLLKIKGQTAVGDIYEAAFPAFGLDCTGGLLWTGILVGLDGNRASISKSVRFTGQENTIANKRFHGLLWGKQLEQDKYEIVTLRSLYYDLEACAISREVEVHQRKRQEKRVGLATT